MIKRIYTSTKTGLRTVVQWKGISRVVTLNSEGRRNFISYPALFKDMGLMQSK